MWQCTNHSTNRQTCFWDAGVNQKTRRKPMWSGGCAKHHTSRTPSSASNRGAWSHETATLSTALLYHPQTFFNSTAIPQRPRFKRSPQRVQPEHQVTLCNFLTLCKCWLLRHCYPVLIQHGSLFLNTVYNFQSLSILSSPGRTQTPLPPVILKWCHMKLCHCKQCLLQTVSIFKRTTD